MKLLQNNAQPANLFDFWVGDWDLSWTDAKGVPQKGRNRITRILDGAVIEENFEGLSGPTPRLKGRSVSVLHTGSKVWKQTWVDSQGSYISLTAQTDGEKRIFQTDTIKRNGKEIIARMVFHTIQRNSFIWDWESTADGGKTWQNIWHIEYKRRR